ncbi:hypothetical protein JCM8097_000489 [Rhodosporidiobolus ruineniae]
MLTQALVSLLALSTAVMAGGSDDYGKKDGGKDIFVNNEASTKDKQLEVSFKEICYRNLYANADEFKQETQKEISIKDDSGKDVFVFDGFRKDENDVEFYFREFCYKDFNFKKHDDSEEATQILDVNGGKSNYKRGFEVKKKEHRKHPHKHHGKGRKDDEKWKKRGGDYDDGDNKKFDFKGKDGKDFIDFDGFDNFVKDGKKKFDFGGKSKFDEKRGGKFGFGEKEGKGKSDW